MYRERYRGFANDFFAQFSKDCRPAQEFVLLIIEKHNGFILFYLCVDHEDLARRTDEKRAPFRVLLYILWEVKCQVYSFWPHFKTPPTTFFDCFSSQGVSLFFAEQNEQLLLSAQLRGFKEITKTNTQRTRTNKNEQKTNGANSISTGFELLCSVVRRGSG